MPPVISRGGSHSSLANRDADRLFVCFFGGVSKAREIRTLPKTSLPVAVLRVAKRRIHKEPDRVKAYVFHIALLGGWCIHTVGK
jgi:hypothetical protein